MTTVIVDIETGPLPDSELLRINGPFCAGDVKLGNVKNPDLIAAKLAEAEANYLSDLRDKSALDALTAEVLAIGWKIAGSDGVNIIGHDSEKATLSEFWDVLNSHVSDGGRLPTVCGFSVGRFDLAMMFRRSFKHRLKPPGWLRAGRYWSNHVQDLQEAWQLGDREARGSLDKICKHLGVGEKNGDGKDFARLWREDRPTAVSYLTNEVLMTEAAWRVMIGESVMERRREDDL